ncbi:dipeptidase [Levilactobacillus brevis]|nr:C69 family dipeptidase [Levilactobacillus brevis]QOP54058.1 dipeptidase [Levilactobacillus brevis]
MKKSSDCTEILVGKAASMDGSTIVARNEDGYGPINGSLSTGVDGGFMWNFVHLRTGFLFFTLILNSI